MAYVLRSRVHDPRIATTHDYRKKGTDDLLASGITGWNGDAESLGQAMSLAERRGDACEGRSAILAVPHELTIKQSAALVENWCRHLNERHGVACAWVIHAPDESGDERNVHAHVIVTGRRSTGDALGEKARELDDRKTGPAAIEAWRAAWGDLAGRALEQAGKAQPVDMRSWKRRLEAEGLPKDLIEGEEHLGPARSSAERRGRKTAAGDRNRRKRRRRKEAGTLIAERRKTGGGDKTGHPRTTAPVLKTASHEKQTKKLSRPSNAPVRTARLEKAVRKGRRLFDDMVDEASEAVIENARSRGGEER
ncbi:MAG: MobA/MobL family protein [Parvibaculum sp.]|nr:MobA/MobL family protein [Parvibaculum sp.]